jgi:hypothetical protein
MQKHLSLLTKIDFGRTRSLKSKIRAERISDFWFGNVYQQLIHYPGNAGGTYYQDGPLVIDQESALRRLVDKPPIRRLTNIVAEQPALFLLGTTQLMVISVGLPHVTQIAICRAKHRLKGHPTLLGYAQFLAEVCELSEEGSTATIHTLNECIAPAPRTLNSSKRCWRMIRGNSGINGLADDFESAWRVQSPSVPALVCLALELTLACQRETSFEPLGGSDFGFGVDEFRT